MAHQTITFDEVATAAAGLQNNGSAISIDAVRDVLGKGAASAIQRHLLAWRSSQAEHAERAEAPSPVIPDSIIADLGRWAQQFAQQAGSGSRDALAQSERDMEALVAAGEQLEAERDELLAQITSIKAARDQALATVAEQGETIERLTIGLNDARQVAADALVGKAKDRLAIDGKDAQLADLRLQIERGVAASASESDARLTAQMELIGAVTARDNFAAEAKDLRVQLAAVSAERSSLRAETEVLRARA